MTAHMRASSKPRPVVSLDQVRARRDEVHSAAKVLVRRIEIGSAVVEALDSFMIGHKRLGDCVRSDLTFEASQRRRQAQAMVGEAEWLERLADLLSSDQTVRDANRDAVLVVLKQRFG